MKKALLFLWLALPFWALGQVDTSALHFSFGGYVEPYYGYDFGQPADANRPGFVYSHNRHNEFNINLALLRGSVSAARVRANLALMAGTYANACKYTINTTTTYPIGSTSNTRTIAWVAPAVGMVRSEITDSSTVFGFTVTSNSTIVATAVQ